MDWTQAFTIMGVLGAFIFWQVNRLHDDIASSNRRLDGHAQRIDQLYQMFIDLLKDKK